MSTLRNVGTWNLALNLGAYCFHAVFGGPLREPPTPVSTKLAPSELAIYPNRSGLVSWKNGIALFLGIPRLVAVKSVNKGSSVGPPSRWHSLHLALPRNRS